MDPPGQLALTLLALARLPTELAPLVSLVRRRLRVPVDVPDVDPGWHLTGSGEALVETTPAKLPVTPPTLAPASAAGIITAAAAPTAARSLMRIFMNRSLQSWARARPSGTDRR